MISRTLAIIVFCSPARLPPNRTSNILPVENQWLFRETCRLAPPSP